MSTHFSLEGKPLNTKHMCIHLDRDLPPQSDIVPHLFLSLKMKIVDNIIAIPLCNKPITVMDFMDFSIFIFNL